MINPQPPPTPPPPPRPLPPAGLESTRVQGEAGAAAMGFAPDEIAAATAAELRYIKGQDLGFTYGAEGGA